MSIAVAIVEDSAPEVRTIIADWIRSAAGLLVGEHSNVESALAQLLQERPDVVLVDINLAGRSGITACASSNPGCQRRSS